jgi:hypothetical protein
VVERGLRDVADPPAGAQVALLPLLLVAAPARAVGVKRPDRLDRGGADRHVRAPGALDVAVLRPRSVWVIGGPSLPQTCRRAPAPSSRARIGPVKTPTSGCERAASISASSQPSCTSTSSSMNASRSPCAAATPALRAAFSPRGRPSAT